jgi:hypothetical protein
MFNLLFGSPICLTLNWYAICSSICGLPTKNNYKFRSNAKSNGESHGLVRHVIGVNHRLHRLPLLFFLDGSLSDIGQFDRSSVALDVGVFDVPYNQHSEQNYDDYDLSDHQGQILGTRVFCLKCLNFLHIWLPLQSSSCL